jgi:hypothetical protein
MVVAAQWPRSMSHVLLEGKVLRTGQTFECDRCKFVQHVDPREFTPYGDEAEILARVYRWLVVSNPPHLKGMDRHFCPNCKTP